MSLRSDRKQTPRPLEGRQASGADYLGTEVSKHYVNFQVAQGNAAFVSTCYFTFTPIAHESRYRAEALS